MNILCKTYGILASLAALCAFIFVGCATLQNPGTVTSAQATIANAVEDTLSIGLVPVLTKNPAYVDAAKTVAVTLGTFSGATLTPADVDAFLAKVPQLTPTDRQTIAGIVNSAWAVYSKRYASQVNANVRPDVALFLNAAATGILNACAAVPKT